MPGNQVANVQNQLHRPKRHSMQYIDSTECRFEARSQISVRVIVAHLIAANYQAASGRDTVSGKRHKHCAGLRPVIVDQTVNLKQELAAGNFSMRGNARSANTGEYFRDGIQIDMSR